MVGSSRTNVYGQCNVLCSTASEFGASPQAANANVISSTRDFTGGATTYSGLLFGATYFVQVKTLWNGAQVGNLTHNASGFFIPLSTATKPVLPTLQLISVDVDSFTVIVEQDGNNDDHPFEVSYSTNFNFTGNNTVSTFTFPSDHLRLHKSFTTGLLNNTTFFVRARALWNSG